MMQKILGLLQTGQFAEAKTRLEKICSAEKHDVTAWFWLGIANENLGAFRDAEACFTHVIAIDPNHAEAHHQRGCVLEQQGRLEEAVTSYRQTLLIRPDWPEAHCNLGLALGAMGRHIEAACCFKEALRIDPAPAILYFNLGNAEYELGRYDSAAENYRVAIRRKPDYAEAYNNMGNLLSRLMRWDEAFTCYRRALEIRPNYAAAHYNMGNLLRKSGRLEDALASYRRASNIRPDSADYHSNVGMILAILGSLDEAMASYQKALEVRPDHESSRLGRATCELLRRQRAEGKRYHPYRATSNERHHAWTGINKSGNRPDHVGQWIDIVFFHIDLSQETQADRLSDHYREMMGMLIHSAKSSIPKCRLVMLTDLHTQAPEGVDEVMRSDVAIAPLMISNIALQKMYLEKVNEPRNIVFVDTDILIQRDLIPVFQEMARSGANLGLTYRSDIPEMPFNYGVIFAQNHPLVVKFWDELLQGIGMLSDQFKNWYGNQIVLTTMLDRAMLPGNDEISFAGCLIENLNVTLLPCRRYNFTPDTPEDIDEQTYVLHFKGDCKQLMREVYRLRQPIA